MNPRRQLVVALLGAAAVAASAVVSSVPATAATATTAPAAAGAATARTIRTHPLIPVAPAPGALRADAATNSSSGNWSGYIDHAASGVPITSVSASWTVPAVNTSTTATYSSTWIGIDGATNSNLIQTGTSQDYVPGTGGEYYAWWEILPASETYAFPVRPLDAITAAIWQTSGTTFHILLQDLTNGQSISKDVTYAKELASAEFVHEAPTVNGRTATLATTTTPVQFMNARVNGAGAALRGAEPVTMVQNGTQVSTPSFPNAAANAFTVAHGSAVPVQSSADVVGQMSGGDVFLTSQDCLSNCSWRYLDTAPGSRVVAGAGSVYELTAGGDVREWTGTQCGSGSSCPGWATLDRGTSLKNIAVGSGTVFQLDSGGNIWRATGEPCDGTSCPGWQRLDRNAATIAITAGAGTLFQLHADGSIWRWTGAACAGSRCAGWKRLDNNGTTNGIVANATDLFQTHVDGSLWRWTGTACTGDSCPGWAELDNNPALRAVTAGQNTVFYLDSGHNIWRSTLTACTGTSCPGWTQLDNNGLTTAVSAGPATVYQLHSDGQIWRSDGRGCSGGSCPGWSQVLGTSAVTALSADNAG